MVKPVIVTRAGKGSALTFNEGDSNFTNLRDATITVAADSGTSQTLDLNDTLTIAGGTNLTSVASATDTVTINLDTTVTGLTSLTSTTIVTDTINGSSANGPIVIAPDGTGDVHLNADSVRIGDNNADATLATRGTGDLILTTNEGAVTEGVIRIYDGANGNITVTPNGTGDVQLVADTVQVGDSNANATITTNGTGDLILNTNSGTNSGSITIQDAANGAIIIAPNGTGRVQILGTSSNAGGIEFYEDTDNGSNKALVTAPSALSADVTLTLPATTSTLGYQNLPAVGTKTGSYTLATTDVGKYVQVGSGGSITIPDATFAEGDVIMIANNHSAAITITCTITTAYIAGTDTDKASVSLATRGIASIVFLSSTVCIITGNVS